MTDIEAYKKYPGLRHWYNKLWLSERLNYNCGPASIPPDESGWYVVRPIMNLSGMGLGASKVWIEKGDYTKVQPGFFWCEWFEGNQYSVTYEWMDKWQPISCWEGIKEDTNLSKFNKWKKTDFYPLLSPEYDELQIVNKINVEFIGENPIEVHLRTSPDPNYDELIPVWEDNKIIIDKYLKIGYSYIIDYDDAEGFLEIPRIGFLVKNNKKAN